jgi:hypothetical protein
LLLHGIVAKYFLSRERRRRLFKNIIIIGFLEGGIIIELPLIEDS